MDRVIEKKGLSRKSWLWIISSLSIISLISLAYASTTGASRVTVNPDRLTLGSVINAPFREYIPVSGTVQPIKTVLIDAVEGGTVQEIFIEDGKQVSKGEPILRLSNPSLQMDAINREAQLLDQQNNLRSTRISMDQQTVNLRQGLLELDLQLKQAIRLFNQNKELHGEKYISSNEYEKSAEEVEYLLQKRKLLLRNIQSDSLFRASQVGQIESSLHLINKNLSFLQSSLENLIVKAPIDGQLSALKAELGQTKGKGENIAQVDQMHDFKVKASVGEHYLNRISIGQTGEFQLAGKSYRLTIVKVFPEVAGGEFEVDMVFEGERPENIRRGQSLQIKLSLGDEQNALLIPRGGFYQDTGGNWVYVLNAGKAIKKEIRLGRQNPDYYEVMSGLSEGEQVVVSRYENFNNADELILQKSE